MNDRSTQIDFNLKIARVKLIMNWLMTVCPCLISWEFQSKSGWFPNRFKTIRSMTKQALTQKTNMVVTKDGNIEEDITVGSVVLARFATFPGDTVGIVIPIFLDYHLEKFNQSYLPLGRNPERGSPIKDDVFSNPKKYRDTLNFAHEQYEGYIILLAYGGDLERDKGRPGFIGFHSYNSLRDNGLIVLCKSSSQAKEKRRNHVGINVGNALALLPADDDLRKEVMLFSITIEQELKKVAGIK